MTIIILLVGCEDNSNQATQATPTAAAQPALGPVTVDFQAAVNTSAANPENLDNSVQSAQTTPVTTAEAKEAEPSVFADYLGSNGIIYLLKGKDLEISIAQTEAIAAIPEMQKNGILNSDITQTTINTAPFTILNYIGLFFTNFIIEGIYDKNPNIDKINVKIFLLTTNDYGNEEKHLLYSFKFNRDLYQKINWSNFNGDKLTKIAPEFKISLWNGEQLEKELGI